MFNKKKNKSRKKIVLSGNLSDIVSHFVGVFIKHQNTYIHTLRGICLKYLLVSYK